MIIRGIFTNTKLSPTRMNSETTVPYIVANECPGLKRGDNLIISDKEHVGESIARIVSNSYGQQTNS